MSEKNVNKIVDEIIEKTKSDNAEDVFWDKADKLLLKAIFSYLMESESDSDISLDKVVNMLSANNEKDSMDKLFDELKEKNPNSESAKIYAEFTDCAGNVRKSIYISSNARLAKMDSVLR